MRDAANGLDALNSNQVQHRDVKPGNLLLLNSGVKVADFGLAKALEQTVASNSGAGTFAYTAPECFKGQLTHQSDQYSLAATYYHLRTGEPLFKGDQAQVMYGHLQLAPNLSHLQPAEGLVLGRALSKEPAQRWQDCKMFVNQLIEAHNRPKHRDHQNLEAERRRQEQECQKHEAEPKAPESRRQEENAPNARPAASPGGEACWYCKKNEANGQPADVRVFLKLSRGSHSEALFSVPRCRACQHRHIIAHFFFWSPTGIGIFNFFCLVPIAPSWVWQGWLWMGSLGLMVAGAFWGFFWYHWWLKSTVADFPEVKSRLDSGWRL
jgi:serine/threonine protein kinase